MTEENEKRSIEKIKLLDTLLLAFGGGQDDVKIIIKALEEDKHFTMKITKDLVFDVHETKEGANKEYTPITKEKFELDTSKLENMALELVQCMEPVDADDRSLEWTPILVMKRLDFGPLAQNRRVEIGNLEQLSDVMTVVEGIGPLKSMEFRVAMTFENGIPKYMIVKLEGKLYRTSIDAVVGVLTRYFDSQFVRLGVEKMKERTKELTTSLGNTDVDGAAV